MFLWRNAGVSGPDSSLLLFLKKELNVGPRTEAMENTNFVWSLFYHASFNGVHFGTVLVECSQFLIKI